MSKLFFTQLLFLSGVLLWPAHGSPSLFPHEANGNDSQTNKTSSPPPSRRAQKASGNRSEMQKPREVLQQELMGRLIFDKWNEIVSQYRTNADKGVSGVWVFIDGKLIRRLPPSRPEDYSDAIFLPPGNYKLEVLRKGVPKVDSPQGEPKSEEERALRALEAFMRLAGDEEWMFTGQQVSVEKGAATTLASILTLPVAHDFFFFEGSNFPLDPGFAIRSNKDLQKYENAIQSWFSNLIHNLTRAPVVAAILELADQFDQHPPISKQVWANFPDEIGGPHEVDSELVRTVAAWVDDKTLVRIEPLMAEVLPRNEVLKPIREWVQDQREPIMRRLSSVADKLSKAPK